MNENSTIPNLPPAAFTASIEMIKHDDTDRHTHALTHFMVTNTLQNPDKNSTIYNGTTTISLLESPAFNVPTIVEKSHNGNVFKITIDPEKSMTTLTNRPFVWHYYQPSIYELKILHDKIGMIL